MDLRYKIKRQYRKFAQSEGVAKLKKSWDEDPYVVIGAATAVVYVSSKLIGAVGSYRNSRAWKKEVERRIVKNSR